MDTHDSRTTPACLYAVCVAGRPQKSADDGRVAIFENLEDARALFSEIAKQCGGAQIVACQFHAIGVVPPMVPPSISGFVVRDGARAIGIAD